MGSQAVIGPKGLACRVTSAIAAAQTIGSDEPQSGDVAHFVNNLPTAGGAGIGAESHEPGHHQEAIGGS